MRETAKRLRKLLQQTAHNATAATAAATAVAGATGGAVGVTTGVSGTGVDGHSTDATIVPDSDNVPLSSSTSIASTSVHSTSVHSTSVHSTSVHSTGSEGLIPKKKHSKKKGVKGTKKWLRRAQVGE